MDDDAHTLIAQVAIRLKLMSFFILHFHIC
jgi:hypothetical protein